MINALKICGQPGKRLLGFPEPNFHVANRENTEEWENSQRVKTSLSREAYGKMLAFALLNIEWFTFFDEDVLHPCPSSKACD